MNMSSETTDEHSGGRHRGFLLILVAYVSQFGNWLTFLALVIGVQRQHGSAATVGIFMAQTLPALFAARPIAVWLAKRGVVRPWIGTQIALALSTVCMTLLWHDLLAVYAYAAVSMLLRAVANPLFFSLVEDSTSESNRTMVFAGVGSAGSVSLVLAPTVGGLISERWSIEILFAADAVTFLFGAIVIAASSGFGRRVGSTAFLRARGGSAFRKEGWGLVPSGTGTALRPTLIGWPLLLLVGAMLNSVELPLFFDVLRFGDSQFGLALSLFGVGSGIAIWIAKVVAVRSWVLRTFAGVFLLSMILWLVPLTIAPYAAFAVAGAAYTITTAVIRAELSTRAAIDSVDSTALWAWASQVTLLANLVGYGLAAISYVSAGGAVWISYGFLLALSLTFSLFTFWLSRHPVRIPSGEEEGALGVN